MIPALSAGLQGEIAADSRDLQSGGKLIKVFVGKGQGRKHGLFDLDTNLVHVKVASHSKAWTCHLERKVREGSCFHLFLIRCEWRELSEIILRQSCPHKAHKVVIQNHFWLSGIGQSTGLFQRIFRI